MAQREDECPHRLVRQEFLELRPSPGQGRKPSIDLLLLVLDDDKSVGHSVTELMELLHGKLMRGSME